MDEFRVGIQMFNAREFFEAHEVLEDLWRDAVGPHRDLYQGILQIGVGFHHLLNGNHHGATTLLERGIVRLTKLEPDDCQGVDCASLINAARRCKDQLVELGPTRVDAFDRALIPQVQWRSTS